MYVYIIAVNHRTVRHRPLCFHTSLRDHKVVDHDGNTTAIQHQEHKPTTYVNFVNLQTI